MQLRSWQIFALVAATTLLVQHFAFTMFGYVDHRSWEQSTLFVVEGRDTPVTHTSFGYPGTLLTLPASVLVGWGMGVQRANLWVMVVLISLFVGAIAVLCDRLRPRTAWWMVTGALLAITSSYVDSTPPSALATLACVLIVLATLTLRSKEPATLQQAALFGCAGGLGLLARFDITLLVFSSACFYLLLRKNWNVWVAGVVAVAIAFLGTPELHRSPVEYVSAVLEKIGAHAGTTPFMGFLQIGGMNQSLLFGALGFLFATALLLFGRNYLSIPRDFLLWLVATTLVITTLLFVSAHHPLWLFYPLTFIWEVIFALLILDLRAQAAGRMRHLLTTVLGLMVAGHILSLVLTVHVL